MQKYPYLSRLMTLLLSTVAPAFHANAQDYGKVGAVNLDATGTPPGGSARALEVGGNVIHKERIVTSAKGSTQILFPDQSTLNVGSNSNILIDEFVYDPKARTGKMVATATKGVLRYVGGQISHTAGATITTPVASLGIRGGIVTVMLPVPRNLAANDPYLAQHQGEQLVIAHFGAITLTNSVSSVHIRPGFAVLVGSPNQPISSPFRPSDAFLQQVMHFISSNPGQHGGVGNAHVPTENTIVRFGFGTTNVGTPPRPPGSNPPGSDPLGYTTIFGGGSDAARGHAQSAPPYP
jgi:hypothetical protein